MLGNLHVRFLGGKGVVILLPYPTNNNQILSIIRGKFSAIAAILNNHSNVIYQSLQTLLCGRFNYRVAELSAIQLEEI